MKKLILLFLIALSSTLWENAHATEYTGVCGDHMTWTFNDEDSTLYILGYGIMQMDDGGFATETSVPWYPYRNQIAHVYIQEGITRMYGMLFYGYTKLRDVIYFPSSVKELRQGGMFQASGITGVIFSEGFEESVGINFLCDLKRIVLPSTTTYLGWSTFGGTLSRIDCYVQNPAQIDCSGAFDNANLSQCTLVVPQGTAYLWQDSSPWNQCTIEERSDYLISGNFSSGVTWSLDTCLKSLTFAGVGAIPDFNNGTGAPWNAYKPEIYKITLSENITHIGQNAFSGCTNLRSIYVENPSFVTIGESALDGVSPLTVVIVNNGDVADYQNDTQWSALTIRKKQELTCAISGNCGENLSDNLLWDLDTCSGDLTITGRGRMFYNAGFYNTVPWYDYAQKIKRVSLPEGLTYISACAFAECHHLTSLVIPDSVTEIARPAFFGCYNLRSITMPKLLRSINGYNFYRCFALDTIRWMADSVPELISNDDIPNSCKIIVKPEIIDLWKADPMWNKFIIMDECTMSGKCGESVSYAVDTCRGTLMIHGSGEMSDMPTYTPFPWVPDWNDKYYITSIQIEDGVTHLASSACCYMPRVQTIQIPNSVQTMGDWQFDRDSALVELTLPNQLEYIPNRMCQHCVSLRKINIPSTVQYIGSSAFYHCSSLDTIDCYLAEPVPAYGFYAFDCENCTLIVNPGTKSLWEEADTWSRFNIVERIEFPTAAESTKSNTSSLQCPCYDMQGKPVNPNHNGMLIDSNGKKHIQR